MKTYKKLLLLFLAVISFLALAACGDDEEDLDRVTITYYITEDSAPIVTSIDRGSALNFQKIPSRNHYKFLGLFDEQGSMVVDSSGRGTVIISQDLTLYMRWEATSVTFRFDTNGGTPASPVSSFSMKYGDTVAYSFPTVQKEGYTFLGWYSGSRKITDSNGVLVSGAGTFTSDYYYVDGDDVYLTAKFELLEYNVIFNFGDGNQQSITVAHGEEIPEDRMPDEKDTGTSVITGWTSISGSTVPFEGTVTRDLVLFPIWKNYKTIEFYLSKDDTEPDKTLRVFEGESQTPYTPERFGYGFDGWYTSTLFNGNPELSVHYHLTSTKLYARWNMEEYEISFVTNNGTVLDTVTYNIESELELPSVTKENFTFLGWCAEEDLSDTPINEIVKGTHSITTLYAKFKGDNKTVVLAPGAGTLSSSQKQVEYYADYKLPVPKSEGFEFQGWFDGEGDNAVALTDKDGNSLDVWDKIEDSTTVYAKYKQKFYLTVTPSVSGATVDNLKEYYVSGDEVALSAPQMTGYDFIGWFENDILLSSAANLRITMGAENRAVELRYDPKVYTVTLNAAGGMCRQTTATIKYGEKFELPVAYKQGYSFLGWSFGKTSVTDANGSSTATWKYTENNITLTASYTEDDSGAIVIFDADSLLAVKDAPGGYYVLVDDVDLSGVDWVPFEFTGTLIGNGYSIKNLSLSSSEGNLGMFTKITGTVKDVVLKDISVVSTSYESVAVGGLCAELAGGTISGVEVYGTVKGDFCRVGGIVGSMNKGSLKNCKNYAEVSSDTYETAVSAGGVVSIVHAGEVSGCKNYGEVSIGYCAGGVVGVSYSEALSELENHGKVSGKNNVGGVIGLFEKAGTYNVNNLKNTGSVTGEENTGGVVGKFVNHFGTKNNDSTYTMKLGKFINEGAVTGTKYVGGVIGYLTAYVDGSGSDGSTIVNVNAFENSASASGTQYVGGIVGYAYSDNGSSQMANSKSSGAVTAESYVGGLAGRLENVKMIACSNAGASVSATYYYLDSSSYYAYVGGYVGYGYYVENCHNAVQINYTERGMYVGGIAGRLNQTMKNCSNTAKIAAENANYVGGLVGEISATGNYEVMQLTNSGSVKGKDYVGGIFGALTNHASWNSNDDTYTLKMGRLTNSGAVSGVNQVGGCIGRMYAAITGNYSDGSVVVTASGFENTAAVSGTTYVGGLIGYAYSDTGSSQLTSSKSSGAVTAEAYVGGLAGRLENVKMIACSNAGASVSASYYAVDGTSYYAYVGGYVGYGYYIENCHNAVQINYAERGMYVGGIAGRILNTMKNCSNTANVTAANASYVGGLVGELALTGSYEAIQLTNSGAVSGKDYVGGIFGALTNHASWNSNDDTYTLKMGRLTNSGAVSGVNQVGGCIGRMYAAITGNYSDGSVVVTASGFENTAAVSGTKYAGGLFGYAYSDNGSSQIASSKSSGAVTAEAYVGGLAGQLENIKLVECSNAGASVSASYYVVDGTTCYAYVGGYVGKGYYIENCNNAVSITYEHDACFVGGLAGQLTNTLKDCKNTAIINAPNASYVGGLVGEVHYFGSYEISNLQNQGAVTGKSYVGGVIGKIFNTNNGSSSNDTHYTMKLNKFNNTGAVIGVDYVGGCVGYIYTNVYGSYSDGSVTISANDIDNNANVTGETNAGGLIGEVYSDSSSSLLTDYDCKGLINGVDISTQDEDTQAGLLIATKTNFKLNK